MTADAKWHQTYTCGCIAGFPKKKAVDRICAEHEEGRKGKPVRNPAVSKSRKRKEKQEPKKKRKKYKPMPDPMVERLERNRVRCRTALKEIEATIREHGVLGTEVTWAELGQLTLLARGLRDLARKIPQKRTRDAQSVQ